MQHQRTHDFESPGEAEYISRHSAYPILQATRQSHRPGRGRSCIITAAPLRQSSMPFSSFSNCGSCPDLMCACSCSRRAPAAFPKIPGCRRNTAVGSRPMESRRWQLFLQDAATGSPVARQKLLQPFISLRVGHTGCSCSAGIGVCPVAGQKLPQPLLICIHCIENLKPCEPCEPNCNVS